MKVLDLPLDTIKLNMLQDDIENNSEMYHIQRNDIPVIDIISRNKRSRIKPHPIISKIKINYDPTEPLDKDEWIS